MTQRDEQVARFVRLARRIHGKPIRVRLVELLMRAIRVHAGKHDEPVIVRGAAELAEQVAPTQVLGRAVQRHPARIVRHDAAGVDDDALGVGSLPVLAPPGDVVARGVNLRDVRLAPAEGAPVPRQGAGRGRRGCLSLRSHGRQA